MLVMMMFSFLLLTPCLGFQQAYKGHDLTSDLAGIELSPNKVRITEAMHTIINTMNKVEKLPSCQKLASQALLNTCSEIDHATSLATDKGIDVMLERSKSIYATRLAICELMDANAVIPASCSPFRPVENDSKFDGFRGFIVNGYFTKPTTQHKFEDRGDLDQCSASLSSNPVWWTSYSNARQNAVLLCHSMRSELDKDDMMEKMRLMFEAILEASSVMSDTTEEHHTFQRQWTEMGKGMQSFHLALNTDREIQNRIMDQWAQFQAGVHDLGNNIQDLGRDVERVRQASSGITSDLEDHRLKAQTAHADVTKHLNQVLDVAIQIDRSHDNSLATSMALNQQNQDLAYTLARNAETARALHYQTEVLLEAIFTVTENVTDAARTVSEFQNDIQNLPTKVIQQVLAASIGGLPIGILAIVLLSLFWCFAFALLDTTHMVFFATPRISTAPTLSILGFVGFAIAAAFACKLWYKQQATCDQLADDFDQDDKPSVLLPQTTYDTEPLLS
ncbi:hypothetical protein D6D15_05672 [Aureobasidium pullulans]|uniref:Nuclear fusion protein KAR5 n=1 Tax=Aureobasidium pullulans TaxID=5580 RepID=A0A4S9B8S7_AURPU|nr:hypothetical protein D6D15_05672 [Aureobasidium pullulans]